MSKFAYVSGIGSGVGSSVDSGAASTTSSDVVVSGSSTTSDIDSPSDAVLSSTCVLSAG